MKRGPFTTEHAAMAGVHAKADKLGVDTVAAARIQLADALLIVGTLGAYDRRVVDWLANADQPTLAVISDLFWRAFDTGYDAALEDHS